KNFIGMLKGREAPLLSGEQARGILKIDLAIGTSAKLRREVYVDELDAKNPGRFTRGKIKQEMRDHPTVLLRKKA
ncbi:MAG: hypothetical protein AB1798_23800, partial [Spirochaetota bacterium]